MKLSTRSIAMRRKQRGQRRSLRFESLELRQLLSADITGTIYNDADGNGVRNQGEKGLVNWTVFLDLNRDGVFDAGEPSALTDADGDYAIRGVAAGDYRVAEVVRIDWTPTNPTTGYLEVTVADGKERKVDFLNQGSGGTGVITGNVWRDLNANGEKDAEDSGIAGWTVFLDLNGNKDLDADEPFELTDGNGDYTFTGILGGAPGDPIDYEVQQVLTPGWEPAMGFDENLTAPVVEGQTTVLPDFANSPVERSSVSGVVWSDVNGNGLRDGGEPGLSGWTVFADINTNNELDPSEPRTTTSSSGGYSLFGLEPGNVRIAEVQHIDFKPTSPATGYRTVVAPNSGSLGNVDFGNQERTDAAIGGVIFVDRDKNGARDPGEEGLPGITVYLDDNNNGSLDAGEKSTVTSADLFYTPEVDEAGSYRFDHLAKGTYIVRQIVPAELSSTPETEQEHTVTVGPADDRSDVDGGDQYRPSEIHGFNFEDFNGNHVRDAGEPGTEGVTIFIDLNRNNVLDDGEPTTLTAADGSYSFVDLEAGGYVVREVIPDGFDQTFPETLDGILWPAGVSNPAVGNVTPTQIQLSLAEGDTHTETVSLTLPTTGALTNMVDVFLLFDDTGSFTFNSPIVRAAFPNIIAQLQTRLPGIDLGFGVGRLEEYGNFAAEYSTGRPFILNQPIIASDVTDFSTSIQAALDHEAPGYGGDQPETVIEALYQMVSGAGFDGDNNGSLLDSGPAGLWSTQVNPGNSGDVPPFASFTPDATNGVLPASGSIGGAGFRSGALPIIITATDTGFAYQPKGESTVTGIDGLTLPVSQVTYNGRGTTPFSSGAGVQETVTGLNALGALVIGLGTNDAATVDPRIGLEALANLTGAINRTATSIANGTPDPIDPGDPFYFKIGSGGDPLVLNIADGIVAAIDGAVTSVNVNVTLRASDPRVHIDYTPGLINGLGAGDTATFDLTFTGDGRPHRFDLQFIREGADVVLGSIPVVLGTPIPGDGYEFEDCEDGEHSQEIDFGNQRLDGFLPNVAPSFTIGADQNIAEDSLAQSVAAWATNISPGPAGESGQTVNFIVSNDNAALFTSQPAISPSGTLTYALAADAFGMATVAVELHDNGGTTGGGIDTSAPQAFTINVTAVNDAPVAVDDAYSTSEDTALTIAAAGVLGNDTDVDSTSLTATLGAGPANGSVTLNPDGSFTYTPNPDFNGSDSFTYVANDGSLDSNSATVSITVTAVNDAPVAVDDSYTTSEDAALTIAAAGVLGNDTDVDSASLTATLGAGPANGSVTLNSDGSFTYTPNPNFNGSDSFTYVANDGALDSNPATVSITVTAVNDAPVAVDDSYTTSEDQALTIAAAGVLANDNDADGDSLTASLVAGPRNGAVTLDANGSFKYMPNAGFSGSDSFTYRASDNALLSGQALVTIQVNATPTSSGARFFVVDLNRRTFKYDADGNSLGNNRLNKEDKKPRGIAASPDGTTLWVLDDKGEIFVYGNDNRSLGSWKIGELDKKIGESDRKTGERDKKIGELDKPEGITVHGDDVWVVDRETDRVYFFEGAALQRSGRAGPTSSFRLDRGNRDPMDLVTDGTHIWVVNDTRGVDKVFRYSVDGTLEGSWQIDAGNTRPTGLTIDPDQVNHIWIVDSRSDSVYQYDGATGRTAGQQAANPVATFALDPNNRNPQGIADPPPATGPLPSSRGVTSDDIDLSTKTRPTEVKSANPLDAQSGRHGTLAHLLVSRGYGAQSERNDHLSLDAQVRTYLKSTDAGAPDRRVSDLQDRPRRSSRITLNDKAIEQLLDESSLSMESILDSVDDILFEGKP